MKLILVVCTGNTCRSPMVAGLLQARLFDEDLHNQIRVASAGTHAPEGRPAHTYAFQQLIKLGISIGFHQASQLTREKIKEADLIIVFEEAHRKYIFDVTPEQIYKVYLLSELANQSDEVADPHGKPEVAYRQTLAQVGSYIEQGWEVLLARLSLSPSELTEQWQNRLLEAKPEA